MLIYILDTNHDPQAVIDNYWNDTIKEGINREYIFTFNAVVDEDKSPYIVVDNIVEIEDNYFRIVYVKKNRSSSGAMTISVVGYQVAMFLNLPEYNMEYFASAGTPTEILTEILDGTPYTVGTVEFTDPSTTFSIQETSSRRGIMIQFGDSLSGEYKFDKYEVSLLIRRGADNGNQLRVGKNVHGITKHTDMRSGSLETAYDVDMIELRSIPGFEEFEAVELGDDVQIMDPDLDVDEIQRIVEYSYSPKLRMNSKLVIANFIEGIEDTVVSLQQTTTYKDKFYYGTRIGPTNGIEIIRTDNKARSIFNADTFKMQTGDGTGSNWVDAVYFDTADDIYKFTGVVQASSFIGGDIAIGSGNDIFKADAEGIYLGHADFASAPFSVDMDGHMIAVGGEFSGEITASIITGGQINGSTITGAVSQNQSAAANRVWTDLTGIHANDSSGVERVRLSSTPVKGTKAWHFYGPLGPAADPGFILHDTETFDGASRTGLYTIGPGLAAILLGNDGSFRALNSDFGGFRAVGTSRPQFNIGGGGWNDIAMLSEVNAKQNSFSGMYGSVGVMGSDGVTPKTLNFSNGVLTSVV